LSLTGVAIELGYVDKVLFPEMETLKRKYFSYHVDEPLILHRKELINKMPPFEILRDKKVEREFNFDLLKLISEWNYKVFTVVIDKIELKNKYITWQYDPYHYCLLVLLERFVLWLESIDAMGDVLAESRGGKEDMRLKKSYNRLYHSGSDYIAFERFSKRLTSEKLKVKLKANNISGLQLADLIAHPSFIYVLCHNKRTKLPDTFGTRISEILISDKYYRDFRGKIDGWGIKLLP
jgi:hypothetical protein